jgi:hypothetical protein
MSFLEFEEARRNEGAVANSAGHVLALADGCCSSTHDVTTIWSVASGRIAINPSPLGLHDRGRHSETRSE